MIFGNVENLFEELVEVGVCDLLEIFVDLLLLSPVLIEVVGGENDAEVVAEALNWQDPLVGLHEVAEQVELVLRLQEILTSNILVCLRLKRTMLVCHFNFKNNL